MSINVIVIILYVVRSSINVHELQPNYPKIARNTQTSYIAKSLIIGYDYELFVDIFRKV